MTTLTQSALQPPTGWSLDRVQLNLRGETPAEIIEEILVEIDGLPGVRDPARLRTDLKSRLATGPVTWGDAAAVPHVRTSAVNRIIWVAARHPYGVVFDADQPAVRLVFLVATPEGQASVYLRQIAWLARCLNASEIRSTLLTAQTEPDFLMALGLQPCV